MNAMRKTAFITIIFYLNIFFLGAQPVNNNPNRNYFRNPLDIPIKLSANMGELRPDHWHMGLDIRTNAKENIPVYAAAEGYIAHIGIRANGFGRFIVINHPNGLSTLYAHLNDFNEQLEAYVREQQYKQESWAIELDFNKSQFPVSKGSFIAYSGNTGGSQGPHLHFEIIETATQKRLNPLLYNFNVQDYVAPTILKLALYDRSKSLYAQTPILFPLKNTDEGYIIPKLPVLKTGLHSLSFAIQAYDQIEKGGGQDGIYSARLFVDETPVISFIIDSIEYDERVYMNAHIDYRYDQRGGPYLQLLTELPGNRANVYKKYAGDGIVLLNDTLAHSVSIHVSDPHGNVSRINFLLQHDDSLTTSNLPAWQNALAPNKNITVEKPGFKMKLNPNSLYDTVPGYYSRSSAFSSMAVTAMHTLNEPSFPLHGEAWVSLQVDKTVADEWKDRIIMQRSSGSNNYRKAVYKDGWVSASFGDFGNFQAFADLTPPQINELGKGDTINLSSTSQIVFTPTDNFNVIKSFRVELDGNWLRFTNDKSRHWIYKFDEHCPYGIHELKATAMDLAGNTTVKTWWFKRYPYTPPAKKKIVKSKKSSSKKKKK
jgi:hypothetical protein